MKEITDSASEVLHFALVQYDQDGKLMYAYEPDWKKGAVLMSHRPKEATQFSTAIEATLVMDTWAAKIDWAGEYKDAVAPALRLWPVTERTVLAVYPDGSGLASDFLHRTMGLIGRYEEHCRTLRRFVQTHEDRLTGLSWNGDCHYERPRVHIDARAYRGAYVKASTIAALWPEVAWKRKTQEYPPDGWFLYDWVGLLDDVDLKIGSAEQFKLKPVDRGLDGTPVDLESEVAA